MKNKRILLNNSKRCSIRIYKKIINKIKAYQNKWKCPELSLTLSSTWTNSKRREKTFRNSKQRIHLSKKEWVKNTQGETKLLKIKNILVFLRRGIHNSRIRPHQHNPISAALLSMMTTSRKKPTLFHPHSSKKLTSTRTTKALQSPIRILRTLRVAQIKHIPC